MKGRREIVAETFEPDEPCGCTQCMMLSTFKKQTQMIKELQNRIFLLEMAMRGMDYDEEECECGCGG